MEPLSAGVLTLRADVLKPSVTLTCSTHFLLSVVDTDAPVTSPVSATFKLKSAAVTPVTAALYVAVNRIVDPRTVLPLAP